ncbi:MAG TPA: sigma-70 family RNA polymerase sigma factor [Bacteroidetes bacterium]|nr:sigma-70 family RNA polymerase sigma factor [Bacteroidota bacterium]
MAQKQNDKIADTVRKEGGRLFNFIRRRVADSDDAEDILQDVYSQLVESYRGLETIERVSAWLFRVARNKITDLYRKKKPERLKQRSGSDNGDEIIMLEDVLPDLSGNPEEIYLREALWEAIEAAVAELPEPQREVFIWHEIEGMSFRALAEFTGESENTLRMRKHYAVRYLRDRLEIFYNEL